MPDRGKRILLIEDSQTYTLLASAILEGMGYTVATAGTAEEGLQVAAATVPDVILMDINLPGMNGYDAVRQIRQDSVLQYLPVIAMTVTEPVNRATLEMGMEAGFTRHTQKPIHEAAFRFVLDTYLTS